MLTFFIDFMIPQADPEAASNKTFTYLDPEGHMTVTDPEGYMTVIDPNEK